MRHIQKTRGRGVLDAEHSEDYREGSVGCGTFRRLEGGGSVGCGTFRRLEGGECWMRNIQKTRGRGVLDAAHSED